MYDVSMPSLSMMYMKELYMFPPLHPLLPRGTVQMEGGRGLLNSSELRVKGVKWSVTDCSHTVFYQAFKTIKYMCTWQSLWCQKTLSCNSDSRIHCVHLCLRDTDD